MTQAKWYCRSLRYSVYICLLALFGLASTMMPPLGHAQNLYGSIAGTLLDSTGAAIPQGSVTATENKTGVSTTAQTNESGNFLVQNLEPGAYTIQITAPGFKTFRQENITVIQNNVTRLNPVLEIGEATQNIVVEAQNSLLQTDRGDVNETIQSQQVASLPLSTSRNFQNLYELIPGFSGQQNTHSAAGNPAGSIQYNVNGVSYSVNSTILDGASDVYQWIPDLALYIPPAESIESFNVVTANYTADQGNVGGAVVTIETKSGGNQFHGSAWEYNVNNGLNAKPYFYTNPRLPKSISNQFGAALGGPIMRNKVFFFADWERTSQRTGASAFYTLPTTALRNGDFTGTGVTIYDPATGDPTTGKGRTPFPDQTKIPVSAAAKALLSYVPAVSTATGGTVANDYLFATTIPSTQDNLDGKLTYTLSDQTNLFAKYSTQRKNVDDTVPFGQAGGATVDGSMPGAATGVTQLATVGVNHTFNTSLVGNATFGYSRQEIGATDTGSNIGLDTLGIPGTNGSNALQGGVPGFSIGSFSSLGITSTNFPFSFRDNQYVLAGAMHWTKGNHTISFGENILYFTLAHFQTTGASFPTRGGFSFSGGASALNGGASVNTLYNAFADFLLGRPNSMGSSYQYTPYNYVDEWEYAFYAADQWQLTHSTTVNYGIRYELYPYAHHPGMGGVVYDPGTNDVLMGGYGGVPFNPGVNTGKGSLLPRFGIAQRISDKTVIRGGAALSVIPSNFKYSMITYPFIIQTNYTGTSSYIPVGSLATGIPALPSLPGITAGRVTVPTGVGVSSYPEDYRRRAIGSYNVEVEHQFLPWLSGSVAYVGNTAHNNCIWNMNAGEPGGGTASEPFYQKFGTTAARNEYAPICESSYNGLHAQLKVQGGGFSGSGVSYAYAKAMAWEPNEDTTLSYNSTDVMWRNRALSSDDLKHNLKIYTVYNLPFGQGQRWANHGWMAAAFGNWSLSNILTKRSGTPFTVSASSASLNSPNNAQTANRVKSSVAIYSAHSNGYHYFDPLAFAPVTTATYGTSGLNCLRGPGAFRLDSGLKRKFAIGDKVSGEFLAQAFAITNTPIFSNPGANVSNATFSGGQVVTYNGYDTITSTSGGNRSAQFGLTLRF